MKWPPTPIVTSSSATSGCRSRSASTTSRRGAADRGGECRPVAGAPEKAQAIASANVLNYDTVHGGIVKLAKSRHFNLQETLVEAILELCLAQPGVVEARVSTESPTSTRIAASAMRPPPSFLMTRQTVIWPALLPPCCSSAQAGARTLPVTKVCCCIST